MEPQIGHCRSANGTSMANAPIGAGRVLIMPRVVHRFPGRLRRVPSTRVSWAAAVATECTLVLYDGVVRWDDHGT